MTRQERTGRILEKWRSGGELCLEWRNSFAPPTVKSGDWYDSPDFAFCNGCWRLRVWPNELWTSGWVWIGLIRSDRGPPETFRVAVGTNERTDGLETRRIVERKFPDDRGWCWEGFCFRHESKDSSMVHSFVSAFILPCKKPIDLTVTCEVKAFCKARGIEKLAEDMARLLRSGEKSDVTVQVKESEYKVHSSVLSARSPVLASLGKESGRIRIDDCKPDVFEQYLAYLYTGSAQNLTRRTVFGLYVAADKYQAGDLKLECLEHIERTLCVQTFCDTVRLALKHGEDDLLRLAFEFASKNIQQILTSEGWQNFIRERPSEANEILVKCFGPPGDASRK